MALPSESITLPAMKQPVSPPISQKMPACLAVPLSQLLVMCKRCLQTRGLPGQLPEKAAFRPLILHRTLHRQPQAVGEAESELGNNHKDCAGGRMLVSIASTMQCCTALFEASAMENPAVSLPC